MSFVSHSGVKQYNQKNFFHLLKTSTKCLGSTKTAYCLLKNAYINVNHIYIYIIIIYIYIYIIYIYIYIYIYVYIYHIKLPYVKVYNLIYKNYIDNPVETGRKLNVHKTFGIRPGGLLKVLCTFNLRPVSTGKLYKLQKLHNKYGNFHIPIFQTKKTCTYRLIHTKIEKVLIIIGS